MRFVIYGHGGAVAENAPVPLPIHEIFERQVSFLVLVKFYFKQSAEVDMYDLRLLRVKVNSVVG